MGADTITFLFSDIEGSTRLWEEHPDTMSRALTRHNEILSKAIVEHQGRIFKTTGDGFCAVFEDPVCALSAALNIQKGLLNQFWPPPANIGVRIAIHTGEAVESEGDFFGPTVNQVARILSVCRAGNILISASTEPLVRNKLPDAILLRDVGEHNLRDVPVPVRIYHLVHPDLPQGYPIYRSPRGFQHNLPLELTPFVGRQRETKEVQQLLLENRLVTLVGSGGVGKTRLALKVASELLENHSDGVWLVELAPLSNPAFIPRTFASALGLHEEPSRPIKDTLSEYLYSRKILMVMDNCEHLITACASLAESWLQDCPEIRILATSRQPLGIQGEVIWRVPCLSLPDPRNIPSVEKLAQYEAIRLFVERARYVQPSFLLSKNNAPGVVEICSRLDGIPLAIELAATRIRFFSIGQVAAKLNKQFQFLTGGSPTSLPRHQTLRAAIDWSYEELSQEEKALFRRLSTFAGGFKLDAAATVCVGKEVTEENFLDLLTRLVDKSFVLVIEGSREEVRYGILEPLRQYGEEKLENSGEKEWITDRYLDYFLSFVEKAEPGLSGHEQGEWLDLVEEEHHNLLRAMELFNPLGGMHFAVALSKFWDVRGYFSEGREKLVSLLSLKETQDPTRLRAKALLAAGKLANLQGDFSAARPLLEESLSIFQVIQDEPGTAQALRGMELIAYRLGDYDEASWLNEKSFGIFRRLNDNWGIAACLNGLANIWSARGDEERACSLYEESLALCEKIADRELTPLVLNNLGELCESQGHLPEAGAYYEKYLAMSRAQGNKREIAYALIRLGNVMTKQGEFASSQTLLEESLKIFKQLKDRYFTSDCLKTVAYLAFKQGKSKRAVRLLGKAESLRESIGSPLSPSELLEQNGVVESLRLSLGSQIFQATWQEGKEMTFEAAIEYGLGNE